MTADQLLQRDARINELEARGHDRTAAQQDELLFLIDARDAAWKRLAGARVVSSAQGRRAGSVRTANRPPARRGA